jgi:dTDP-4-dehydrorhamnose reductase
MTRWVVTGAGGQLGTDLVNQLTASGDEVRGFDKASVDITDAATLDAAIADFNPDVVINAAAYTAVDAAEVNEDSAYAVNAAAPAILAATLGRLGGKLIHVSTDYVFAGDATSPYEPADEPDPKSAYGRTKLAGEVAVRELLPEDSYVVRTAWVYSPHGANFVKTMIRLEGQHDTVSVVDDQRGSPTLSADLASGLIALGRAVDTVPAGTYHLTNAGDTTWFGLTQAIFTELGADVARVQPTTSAAYVRPAPRPSSSVLSSRAWTDAGLEPLPDWRDALSRAFETGGDQLRGA